MTFLSSFEAVRYRGIDGLSLPRLARANLITGVNGIGKTAVLEAMWLFTGRYNTSLLWNTNVQRGSGLILDPVAELADGMLELRGEENEQPCYIKASFQKLSNAETAIPIGNAQGGITANGPFIGKIDVELEGINSKQDTGGAHSTPLGIILYDRFEESNSKPASIILGTRFQFETTDEYLKIYSDMVRHNRKKDFISAINLILPYVQDVEILTTEINQAYVSAVTNDGKQLPLHDLGGGAVRLYQLFLDFFTARNGVVFADELENGLHHSVLEDVWTFSRQWLLQWNVQLVATTHSGECIGAAMAAFEDAPNDLAIHKLYRNEKTGKVEAATFTGETLEGARDLNLEIR